MSKDKPVQLRGENLLNRIREVVTNHAEQAQKQNKPFVLNKAAIARDVPCTRKTLLTYEDELAAMFETHMTASSRRARDGSVELNRLREKMTHIEERNRKLEAENKALVEIHTKLFDKLVMSGVHPSVLADIEQAENILTFPNAPKT